MATIRTKKPFKYLYTAPWTTTRTTRRTVFDIETTGLDCYTDVMFMFIIAEMDGTVRRYRLDNDNEATNLVNWKILKKYMEDDRIEKIGHNIKFDLSFVKYSKKPIEINIPRTTVIHDTMIMSQLLRNLSPRHGLDFLAWELFGYSREQDKPIARIGKALGYHKVPKNLMDKYVIADGERTLLLDNVFLPEIQASPELLKDYQNEISLLHATMRLENTGVLVDEEQAITLLQWLEVEFEKVVNEVQVYFGEYINLNSDVKLKNLLYRRLGFPVVRLSKSGASSTDKEALMELKEMYPAEPVFNMILKWRSYASGITTVEKYLRLRDAHGVIHPTIKTNHAKTGRESSENPNMQNVSKDAALKNLFPVPQRKCFRAPPGHSLYLVDYAGIEMRLIIGVSGEAILINLLNSGGDPHNFAAELFFGDRFMFPELALDWWLSTDPKVKQEFGIACGSAGEEAARKEFGKKAQKILRGASKNGSFAMAYGAGLKKVALTLGISVDELRPGWDNYQATCPKIASFTRDNAKQVKEFGFVTTAFGRKLYVPYDSTHIASNYRIQGTAAGILKRAQVKVDDYLFHQWDDQVKIVLPIHDELIIQVPHHIEKHRNRLLSEIGNIMTDMPEIPVKLDVEWKYTSSQWNKAKGVSVV